MPIYEFKCLKCDEFFELILMNKEEEAQLKCPKCNSEDFERVISTTNFSMGAGSAGNESSGTQTRACSSGSCTTYNIPGYSK